MSTAARAPATDLRKVLYTRRPTPPAAGRGHPAVSTDALTSGFRVQAAQAAALTNPEQLFAAGWSACFISAMQVVAGRKIALPADVVLDAEVDPRPCGRCLRTRGTSRCQPAWRGARCCRAADRGSAPDMLVFPCHEGQHRRCNPIGLRRSGRKPDTSADHHPNSIRVQCHAFRIDTVNTRRNRTRHRPCHGRAESAMLR
jgi:hypothetical protein